MKKGEEVGLKFSRPDFVRDILFSEDGFGLTPRVFTKSTQKLPDDQKIASTSAKDHLPYFGEISFVAQYMDFTRLEKMRGTYVGPPAYTDEETGREIDPRGFWKYIYKDRIHPSFLLHRTVTGRTASANPNAQNFPKRGKGGMKEVVKAFRRVFEAPPGWKILEADLSQAELRVAAWMANERTMIDIYRSGGDIHASTAARTMGMTTEAFLAMEKDTISMKRFQAKAVPTKYWGMGGEAF
nr:DNA polymerase [Labrenzia sp. 011]